MAYHIDVGLVSVGFHLTKCSFVNSFMEKHSLASALSIAKRQSLLGAVILELDTGGYVKN